MLKLNDEPLSISLSKAILPPKSLTNSFEIDKPNPVPPYFLVVLVSP